MSWYTIFSGLVCGLFLLSGFFSLVLALRGIERRINLIFFLFSIVISVAIVQEALALFSTDVETLLHHDHLVNIFLIFSGITFVFLVSELTGYLDRVFISVILLIVAVMLILQFVLPYGISWETVDGMMKLQLAWGEEVHWINGETSPFNVVAILCAIGLVAFVSIAVRHQMRHGDRSQARQLLVMLLLGVLGVAIELIFLELNGTITGIVDNLGFIGFIFLIGHRNFDNLLRSVELIRESDERFSRLTEAAFEGIGFSEHGTIIDVNQQLADMLGYEREELIGRSAFDFVAPKSRELVQEHISEEQELPYEHLALRKDGTVFPVEVRVRTISYKNRNIRVTVIRDVSEYKHAEEQNTLLAQTLKSVQDCISLTDSEDHIIFVNDAFRALYGYEEEEILGRHVSVLRPEGLEPEQTQGIFPSTREGGWHGEIINRRKDGTRFSVELWTSVVRDRDGKPMAYVGVARDTSDRRLAEASLIAEKERAERSERLKDAFIANISHEVRTPLNIILGYTGLIQELLTEKADAEEKGYFDSVRRGAQRLQRTVDMILNISRLQVGDITVLPRELDLPTMLSEIVADYHSTAEDQGLEISFHAEAEDARVIADEYCTAQTLQNLLDNAIKYTEEGSVTVTLRRDATQAIHIVVADTGIGISDEYLPRVFEPYTQEESGYSRSFEGIGLGLSLVKKYSELIGAQLHIESRKGIGTTVTVEFPLQKSISPEGRSPADTAAGDGHPDDYPDEVKPTLLVVEDDMLTVQYMNTLLKKEFTMFSAASGREAWEVLEANEVDLILMDLSLSGDTSGLELTGQIRSQERFKDLPIIAVTAHSMTYDRERCLDAGCNAFLLKPAVRDELMEIITSLLPR